MLRMVNGLVPHFYQGRLEGDITVGNVHIKEVSLPQVAAVAGSVFQNPRTQFFHLDTTGEMAFNLENQKLTLRQLLNYPILMLDRKSTTSEYLHALFQQHQLDLVPEIELSSNDLLLDLASIGLGIAFVPDYCLPKHSTDLFPLSLAEELPSRQLMLVHSEQLPLSPAAKQFLEYFV